jgi:hypothetical protein
MQFRQAFPFLCGYSTRHFWLLGSPTIFTIQRLLRGMTHANQTMINHGRRINTLRPSQSYEANPHKFPQTTACSNPESSWRKSEGSNVCKQIRRGTRITRATRGTVNCRNASQVPLQGPKRPKSGFVEALRSAKGPKTSAR